MLQFLIDGLQRVETRRAKIVSQFLTTAPVESHLHGRKYIHHPSNLGDKLADRIAATMGSWRFIIAQTVIVACWMVLNVAIISFHWDPYPFILLNLLFSTQAAYAAPIIMMSQNRQASKDHLRDDHEAQEVDELYQINEQQLQILQGQNEVMKQQSEILAILHQGQNVPPAPPLDTTPITVTAPKTPRKRKTA